MLLLEGCGPELTFILCTEKLWSESFRVSERGFAFLIILTYEGSDLVRLEIYSKNSLRGMFVPGDSASTNQTSSISACSVSRGASFRYLTLRDYSRAFRQAYLYGAFLMGPYFVALQCCRSDCCCEVPIFFYLKVLTGWRSWKIHVF